MKKITKKGRADKKTVVLADDDPAICDAVGMLLEDQGYHVITVLNGKTLPLIQQIHPDVIVLDIWLAGEDGREICKKIKKGRDTRQIPIIMISASKDAAASAKRAGADTFLPKPFQINDLLGKIKQYTTP